MGFNQNNAVVCELCGGASVAEISGTPTQQRAIDRLALKARHPLPDAPQVVTWSPSALREQISFRVCGGKPRWAHHWMAACDSGSATAV